MKRITGFILIILALGVIGVSLSGLMVPQKCDPYLTGPQPAVGSGFSTLFDDSTYSCESKTITDPGRGTYVIEASIQYRIIPVDFLLIALALGIPGVILVMKRRSARPETSPPQANSSQS